LSTFRSLKVRATKAASVVALALFMIMGVASVAQAAPANSGGGPASDVSVRACQDAGGGTWCQGVSNDGALKHCYSNYIHHQNYHSSTAVMAETVSKGYANAGYWSYAGVTGGWAYTCYTYWNNNA
jgi:hypothetical protein